MRMEYANILVTVVVFLYDDSGRCCQSLQGGDPCCVWRREPSPVPSSAARDGARWTHMLPVPRSSSAAGQNKTVLGLHIYREISICI